MSSILKIYLGIFMMLCMTSFSLGILSLFLSVLQVQNEFQQVVEELSLNDFDSEIMELCMRELEKEGIEAKFTLYDGNGTAIICTEPEMVPLDTQRMDRIKVEMKYPYGIGNWDSEKSLELSGYAW